MIRTALTSLVGAVVLASAGCGATQRPGVTPRETRTTTHAVDPPEPTFGQASAVRVARTVYGRALTDRRGFALYRFTHDRSAASTCYGACALAWPPYVVARRPSAVGPGAHAGLLGIVRRPDGRLQVSYAGHPLYYYVGDHSPHEVLCQAVTEFGGTWNVVAPDGHAVH